MKLIINFRTYNTDTAKIIAKYSNGRSRSDFKYIDETLYRKKMVSFF